MQASLENAQQLHKNLVVVPNLLVHYPLNIYFQVGNQFPVLAERLEYGFNKAKQDGSYQTLVDKHLKEYYLTINDQDVTIIELINKRTN